MLGNEGKVENHRAAPQFIGRADPDGSEGRTKEHVLFTPQKYPGDVGRVVSRNQLSPLARVRRTFRKLDEPLLRIAFLTPK